MTTEKPPLLSILIPAHREAPAELRRLLGHLAGLPGVGEIIVAMGHDDPARDALAAAGLCRLALSREGHSRARLLNTAAAAARGEVLYFLHADTYPPPDFAQHIQRALAAGYGAGSFRMRLLPAHGLLDALCWFTRWPGPWWRFGDQSWFVRRGLFAQVGGYDEGLAIGEDLEMARRCYASARCAVLPATVHSSARRYAKRGVWRLSLAYGLLWPMLLARLPNRWVQGLYRRLA